MGSDQPHILLLESYYGGSHQAFLTGLMESVDCQFTLLSLPARKWKMRMQLAAPWFAEKIIALMDQGIVFDAVLTSTFLDVAVLRSLLYARNIRLPLAVYFHENQFSYPGQVPDPGRFQFSSINFTSALCADSLAFNSSYNLESFLAGVRSYLKKATDIELYRVEERIRAKSTVLSPGMDFRDIDEAPEPQRDVLPVIVWNHRWEHDKDPDTFFETLFGLSGTCDFRLIVLGESFRNQPRIFSRARKLLADQILSFGFAENRSEYARLLKCGTLIISTALHEFFGMAVLEGVRAGCRPLVPDRLSYKELFPEQYRYPEHGFKKELHKLLQRPVRLSEHDRKLLTQPYSWPVISDAYQGWLQQCVTLSPQNIDP